MEEQAILTTIVTSPKKLRGFPERIETLEQGDFWFLRGI